ncbi:MAG: hypothetical protein KJ698_00080 [Actinobacteria bacterium]|nr:hypothetical protein [Actinomycetota bacterium]MBU1493514.1 hypothetical protein [Actinomycetota bacterium]
MRFTMVSLAILVLCGCAAQDAVEDSIKDDFTYSDTVAALTQAGALVEEVGSQDWGPFSIQANYLTVDGHELWVYEYPDTTTRESEASTIAMRGWSVNNTPVEWLGNPHYWLKGRVIVLYLGDDAGVIKGVTSAVGPQLNLRKLDR